MYRLDDPEHAKDIVDIVAFLTDPEAPFHDLWIPDRRGVTVRPLDQEATQSWTWTDHESPYKYLCIRQALFDSRTVVFAGKAKREHSDDEEEEEIFLKSWWSFPDLEAHELRMLYILHSEDSLDRTLAGIHLSSDTVADPVASREVDPRLIESLPKGLGTVVDERVDRTTWATQPLLHCPENEVFTICIMATSGPRGQRMPTQATQELIVDGKRIVLGLRHFGQILLGVCESLWYAASKGIHCRDINLGNILWIWIEKTPGDPTSGRAIGYLIDFGNARHLNNPRRPEAAQNVIDNLYALSMDDGRSATPTYSSIYNFDVQHARQKSETARTKLDEAARNQSALQRADEIQLANAKRDYKAARVAMRLAVHRYLDDLESVIYAFTMQASLNEVPSVRRS